jgi:hypothetical protein
MVCTIAEYAFDSVAVLFVWRYNKGRHFVKKQIQIYCHFSVTLSFCCVTSVKPPPQYRGDKWHNFGKIKEIFDKTYKQNY